MVWLRDFRCGALDPNLRHPMFWILVKRIRTALFVFVGIVFAVCPLNAWHVVWVDVVVYPTAFVISAILGRNYLVS